MFCAFSGALARALGRLIVVFLLFGTQPTVSAQDSGAIGYEYDDLGRLTKVLYYNKGVQYSYLYDDAGNRTSVEIGGLVPAEVRVWNTRILEGGNLYFGLWLTQPVTHDVTVYFETADGTAIAGQDYVAQASSIVIPKGQQYTTIRVDVIDDTVPENAETMTVSLTRADGATIDPTYKASSTGTIRDNDSIYFNASDVTALNEGAYVAVTIDKVGATSEDITVDLATTAVDAVNGASAGDFGPTIYSAPDVALATPQVTFAAAETSKTVYVKTVDETIFEVDEYFHLDLNWLAGGYAGFERAAITIPNDDVPPVVKVANAGNREGLPLEFAVWMTNNSYQPVTLTFEVSDTSASHPEANLYGTATMGVDYDPSAAFAGQLEAGANTSVVVDGNKITYIIAPDTNGFALTIPTMTDAEIEGLDPDGSGNKFEAFFVKLVGVENASPDTVQYEGRGRIRDADATPPDFTVNDVNVSEGGNLVFTVTKTGTTLYSYSINYATEAGSASASEFVAQSGTLTFGPGGTSTQTVTVPTVDDTLWEQRETVYLVLSGATDGATISDDRGEGGIGNNDGEPIINIFNNGMPEGNATGTLPMTVFLQGGTTVPVTVTYKTTDGTATAGSDYEAIPDTTVTIQPGSFEHNFNVTIFGDTTVESDEYFNVVVVSKANARTVTSGINAQNPDKGSNGRGNINNDDYSYSWNTGSWGAWSTCTGTQSRSRTVSCKRSDGANVSDGYCGGGKPATSQTQSCGTKSYSTSYGSWSACQSNNTKTRTVTTTCTWSYGASCGTTTSTETTSCSYYSYSWAYSSWGSWTGTCGASPAPNQTATRSVWCKRSDGASVSDSYCGGTKPGSSKTRTCYTYGWYTSSWRNVSNCVNYSQYQERTVYCKRSPGGAQVSDSSCGGTKPTAFRTAWCNSGGGGGEIQ